MKISNLRVYMAMTGLSFVLAMSGCSQKNSDYGYSETVYDVGEHYVAKIDRQLAFWGKNGNYSLKAPDGYRIVDYDYDYGDSSFEFHDYVFVNDEPVVVKNPNNLGVLVEENVSRKDSKEYGVYEHVIASIDKNLSLFLSGKRNQVFHLTAPEGYTILDYDYDKTKNCTFETITYANTQTVIVDLDSEFGEVKEKVDSDNLDGMLDVGQDKMVVINREMNLFFGEKGKKTLKNIPGYKIIDYDYDKNSAYEFETVVYENVVPVLKPDSTIKFESVDITENHFQPGLYDAYEHVLVQIDRNCTWNFGKDTTKELVAPEGYMLLDYDYDKNGNFEFETFVFTNTEEVMVEDSQSFGKVYTKEK